MTQIDLFTSSDDDMHNKQSNATNEVTSQQPAVVTKKTEFEDIMYNDGICQMLSIRRTSSYELQPLIIGIDEAGRGPLLGPVAVASVILDPHNSIDGLNDSKKLTEKKRNLLFAEICEKALVCNVCFVGEECIDTKNILQATLYGMQQSVMTADLTGLDIENVLIDGNKNIQTPYSSEAVIGGDALHAQISAASILAKVLRDEHMYFLHKKYPHFGIDKHKGYPTKLHKEMIAEHGILPEHRKSFNPIKTMLGRV